MTGPRNCARCRKVFEPPNKGSRARFCSHACRQQALAARRMGLPEALAPEAVVVELEVERGVDDVELITLEQVAAELQRVLRSVHTPPTAKAALAREYRVTLEAIERAKPPARDAVAGLEDQLAARRAARGA